MQKFAQKIQNVNYVEQVRIVIIINNFFINLIYDIIVNEKEPSNLTKFLIEKE